VDYSAGNPAHQSWAEFSYLLELVLVGPDQPAGKSGRVGWQERTSQLARADESAGKSGRVGWQGRTQRLARADKSAGKGGQTDSS